MTTTRNEPWRRNLPTLEAAAAQPARPSMAAQKSAAMSLLLALPIVGSSVALAVITAFMA